MICPQCGHSNSVDVVECEACSELLVDIFSSVAESPSQKSNRSSTLTPGSLLGDRYEILELIGEGGMGCVYKVHDRELNKVVALKLIRSEQSQDPVVVQRFKQELLLARNVTHKNVVRLYDFGEAKGLKFFTMEWIDGENLKERIRRQGALSVEEALPLIEQMAKALEEAHLQGVVHRDLKPQNVMIDRSGDPHIMDFGIARAADTNTMTATGSVMGTPDYMSPEQAYGDKADQQSDLFSLGVIGFEMLTGELPYQAESPLSRVVMRITKKPPAPRELNAHLPAYLEKIVLKCMEADKELRYRTAGEILRDIEEQHVNRSIGLKMRRFARRRQAILAVAAAVLLVSGATLYFTSREESPTPRVEQEGPVTTLAILPFTNATGSDELEWMRTGLPEMLFTDISQSRFVRPVPGERIVKLLRELGVDEMNRFDEAMLQSISEMAPAQSVLYGQFVESGDLFRLDLSLRNAASGVPTPIKVEGQSDQVFALVDAITAQIKEHLDLTPEQLKGDTDRPIMEVSTASLEALEAYQAGLAQLRQGANQASIPFLEKAVAVDSSFAIAQAKLAEAYLNLGDYQKAEAIVERAQKLSESSPLPLAERYQIHAIVARGKNDQETAAASYRDLAELYPMDPDIQLSLAQSLEGIGQWSEAMGAYRKVLDLAPGFGAALMGLGRAQVIGGQPDEAIEFLQGALDTQEFQDDPEALGMIHSILGVAYRDMSRLDEAIEHLDRSLEFRRQSGDKRGQAVTLTNMAAVYEQQGQIGRALEAEQEAVRLAQETGDKSTESMALFNMGLTYQVAGRTEEALETVRASMRIEMDHQDLSNLAIRLDWMGDIYRTRGQYEDAMVYLEQARGYLDSSVDKQEKAFNLQNIGLVRKAQGQYEEATRALLPALAIFRDIHQMMGTAGVQLGLAEVYKGQGRYADAYRALQESLEISQELDAPRDLAETIIYWSHLLITVGQLEKAEKELNRARELIQLAEGGDLMSFLLLGRGRLLRLRGNLTEAESVCRNAKSRAVQDNQKEISFQSSIELGLVYIDEQNLMNAEQVLLKTRRQASQLGLRALEAEAAAVLAEVYLADGDVDGSLEMAQEAIEMAEGFSGLPILFKAHVTLGDACEKLGRTEESIRSHIEVVETLKKIREGLMDEHLDTFMNRPDVSGVLERSLSVLEKADAPEAEAIQEWILVPNSHS